MLLCDVGNTSFHFLDGKQSYKKSVIEFQPQSISEEVYYICVHPEIKKQLQKLPNWINVAEFIDMTPYYETMGIDRIVACEGVQSGVIVDAGSAITVDIVKDGVFVGGYIYPGTQAMHKCYAGISKALDYEFNYSLNLDIIPKNSQDALSYGYLKLLYLEVTSHKMDIILTGGDAKRFQNIFPNAKRVDALLFDSMKKIIKKADLC